MLNGSTTHILKVLVSAAANSGPERLPRAGSVTGREHASGQQVLISAVSNGEASALQPNPEMRNAFITEQQTRAPPGSC